MTHREPFLVDDYRTAQSVTDRPVKMTIPGPLTIMDTTADAHYGNDLDWGHALATALNHEVRALVRDGDKAERVLGPLGIRSDALVRGDAGCLVESPLPNEAAVTDLTMRLGERVIRGQIDRRDEARRRYEDARNAGKVAALLEQERPNIFTQSVANILPGNEIEIVLEYVETLEYGENAYEFTFPMVVGPRLQFMPTTVAPICSSSRQLSTNK